MNLTSGSQQISRGPFNNHSFSFSCPSPSSPANAATTRRTACPVFALLFLYFLSLFPYFFCLAVVVRALSRHRISTSTLHLRLYRHPLSFLIPSALTSSTSLLSSLTMSQQYPSRGKSKPRCTSAGRVTAQVLLSFLAFSTTSLASIPDGRASEQLVLPLPPAGHVPALSPEPPAPADHVFVCRRAPVFVFSPKNVR